MDIQFANMISFIPPEYTVLQKLTPNYFRYKHNQKSIDVLWRSGYWLWIVEFYDGDRYHRPSYEGPAIQNFYDKFEKYMENGIIHRPYSEGPATRSWYKDGSNKEITYAENGIMGRPTEEGPSIIRWHENGQLKEVCYYKNDKLHRPISEGPAIQAWTMEGAQIISSYFVNGKQKTILNEPKTKKAKSIF